MKKKQHTNGVNAICRYQEHIWLEIHNHHDPSNKNSLSDNRVKGIFEDPKHNFWIGTMGDGLNLMDWTLAPEKVYLEYQLEGEDRTWRKAGNNKTAQYYNLPTGDYLFKVRGANSRGLWKKEIQSLKICTFPSWYQNWWDYLLFFSIISGLIYWVYQFQLNRQLALQESKRLATLEIAKTRLYTNITHEFRTHLTVILGMNNKLETYFKDKALPKEKEAVVTIQRNSHQLLGLINQMLDLSKLEANTMSLHLEQSDIIVYLKYLFHPFESMADTKNIRIYLSQETETCPMDFDAEKIRMILSNLLSNAIKFTPENGLITLNLNQTNENNFDLKINDSGIGVSKENLPHIFDRFYQTGDSATRQGEGTGIGLALTKELVELMGGTIDVTSMLDQGTTFIVHLPITHKATLIRDSPLQNKLNAKKMDFLTIPSEVPLLDSIISDSDQYKVLIVENNTDVAAYLKDCLEKDYHLYFAQNGQEGIDKAMELIPDIIISDVMMPLKDGFELCDTLKKAIETSHIPIILLTAKATVEDRITGLEFGADAYLTKPFYPKELAVRLDKLIEGRKQLQAKYGQGLLIETPVPKTEEVFLQQVQTVILDKLDQSGFGPYELAVLLGTSRTQLHLKIKTLTNTSTSTYLNKIRLQEAKKLLQANELSIAEIGYAVGYSSPQYFGRTFSKEFGCSPRVFREEFDENHTS